jgi:hypothetical protein
MCSNTKTLCSKRIYFDSPFSEAVPIKLSVENESESFVIMHENRRRVTYEPFQIEPKQTL